MKKRLLVLLFSLAALALVACGGGNDVASSGASAVSAATSATTPDVIPNTTATTPVVSTPTKPKINGQVDERTGVAPVAAQATIWTVYSNGGCADSPNFGGFGPWLTPAQQNACYIAIYAATTEDRCMALGGGMSGTALWFNNDPRGCFCFVGYPGCEWMAGDLECQPINICTTPGKCYRGAGSGCKLPK